VKYNFGKRSYYQTKQKEIITFLSLLKIIKMQLKSTFVFLGLSFISLTGFNSKKNVLPLSHDSKTTRQDFTPVTITATFTETSTLTWTGYFTTGGALDITGDAIMVINPNMNGTTAHCEITLTTDGGTIIIHEECQFATKPYKGRWEIVDGTGAYTNLRGNGSLSMPDNEEAMVGVIY
jgi:hypothetical protein